MSDHANGTSRAERVVDSVIVKMLARFSMPICTALVTLVLVFFNSSMGDVKEQLAAIKLDIATANKNLSDIKTSDAVQNARIDGIVRADAERDRRLNRIEQKVFP